MKITYQAGSAHAGIIAVLVFALIGALSWIFYQNFLQNTKVISSYKECAQAAGSTIQESYPEVCVTKSGQQFRNPGQEKEETIDRKKDEVTSCMYYEKVCVTHPADWEYRTSHEKLNVRGGGAILKDYDELTSADTDVKITLSNGIGQIGGMCVPEENKAEGLVTEATKTRLTVKTYEGINKTLYTLKMVVPVDGKFLPVVALSSSNVLQKTGKHNACDFMYYGVFEGRENKDGYGLMQVSTEPFNSSKPLSMTYEAAKRALSTESYEGAFSILSSVHYVN